MKDFLSKENIVLAFFAVLGIATVSAYFIFAPADNFNDLPVDQRDLYEFSIQTSNNNSIAEEFKGSWALIEIGYMTCPDVCPTSLAYAAREYEKWGQQIAGVKFAFLSVDPKRDNMTNLKAYVTHFNPNFIALRAEEPELKKFVRKLGGYYSYDDSDSAAGYLVSHSAAFFLVNPRGKLVTTFTEPQVQGKLAQKISKFVKGTL